MKSRGTFVAALFCVAVIAISGGISVFSRASAPVRNFEFTYVTKIPPLPADAKSSRIWIPLPQSDAYQAISDLKIESPFPYATHRDSEYGNEYVYLEVPAAKSTLAAEVRVHFQAHHDFVAALQHAFDEIGVFARERGRRNAGNSFDIIERAGVRQPQSIGSDRSHEDRDRAVPRGLGRAGSPIA